MQQLSDQPGQPVMQGEQQVASVTLDMNSTASQPLFTVPAGRTFIPTRVILRNCSGNLTTASVGFGRNSGTNTDFAASATYTGLADATKAAVISAGTSSVKVGAAADVFGAKCSIAQGSAMTCTCDVFGYLV